MNKKLIKNFIGTSFIILVVYLSLFNFKNESFSIENKILIKIENEIITTVDISNQSKYLIALNNKINELTNEQIFEISKKSLIREKIKEKELKNNFKEIKLNKDFLDKVILSTYSKLNFQNIDEFKKHINNHSITLEDIEKKISVDLLWNQLIYSKFSDQIKINKNDIKEELSKKRSFSKSYLLSEIVYKVSSNQDLRLKTEMINKSISELGFENAALTHSISNSSNLGGKLGWVNENSLNAEIKKIILSLKKGEFSEPFSLPNGYMILKLEDIKEIEYTFDLEKEVEKVYNSKINQQLFIYSNIYLDKISKNLIINES